MTQNTPHDAQTRRPAETSADSAIVRTWFAPDRTDAKPNQLIVGSVHNGWVRPVRPATDDAGSERAEA